MTATLMASQIKRFSALMDPLHFGLGSLLSNVGRRKSMHMLAPKLALRVDRGRQLVWQLSPMSCGLQVSITSPVLHISTRFVSSPA